MELDVISKTATFVEYTLTHCCHFWSFSCIVEWRRVWNRNCDICGTVMLYLFSLPSMHSVHSGTSLASSKKSPLSSPFLGTLDYILVFLNHPQTPHPHPQKKISDLLVNTLILKFSILNPIPFKVTSNKFPSYDRENIFGL